MKTLLTTLLLISTLLVGCFSEAERSSSTASNKIDKAKTNTSSSENSETLYFGGTILTMNGDKASYAEAVMVKNGKISFVGSKKQAFSQKNEQTLLKDLAGKTMMPGFIDPHGHFMFALQMVNQANVALPPIGVVKDIPSLVEQLQKFKEKNNIAKGEWIVGWGYDQDGLTEKRHITKQDLDAHFPDNKVMIIHVSAHGAVLNSKALAWANINAETKTPDGGILARMPNSNEPAGLLMETAYLPVLEKFPQPSESKLLELMKPAQMMYASEGYTHAYEGFTHIKDLDFLKKAAENKKLFLDLTALPAFTEMDKWLNNDNYPTFRSIFRNKFVDRYCPYYL